MDGSPDSPTAPIALTYEAGLSRERLPDGGLRMTIVTGRSGALKVISACAGAAVVLSALAWLVGPRFVPVRWAWLGFAAAPLCLAGLVVTLITPRRQTHVVEVSPAGLRIQTTIAGDPVRRAHARGEVLAVSAVPMGLEVRTTKDRYVCLSFADAAVAREVAAAIRAELNGLE